MRFKNRTAIITGAVRGIGLAAAKRLVQEGANVVITDILAEGMEEATKILQQTASGGKILAIVGDIGKRDFVHELILRTVKEFGRIDVLVNNAGISLKDSLLTGDDDWWNATLQTNLTAMFYTCQLVGRQMVNQDEGGSIINVSSIGGSRAKRNCVAYDTSKGGVEALTRSAAVELAPWAIRVNSIAPAAVLGNYVVPKPAEWSEQRMVEKYDTPLLRQGTPEDCANLIAFLASEDSSFITGQCIAIDGGLSIQSRPAGNGLRITPHNLSDFTTDEWEI